ncbi:helix-turn-helix domain-containing protein [Streptomyces xanthochromogenes]|uniref:helix-turn-helix domain-containing protein n=1 Tax=Streptomyces xanthochromogenes TaxID=67384 RepID=UPI0034160770
MTPKGHASEVCLGPGCGNTVEQTPGSGRRRKYCTDLCGNRYRRYRAANPGPDDSDAEALRLAQSLERKVSAVIAELRAGKPLEALVTLEAADKHYDDVRGAVVQMCYDHKVKQSEMCDAVHVSPDTLGRWKNHDSRRRAARAADSRSTATAPDPGPPASPPPRIHPRHPIPASPPPPRAAGGSPGRPGPPTDTPAATLTRALSHLHRESGLTFRALAEVVRVDPSYVSRIMTGERTPTWKVTRTIAAACGGDPEELRPLWDAARGYHVAQPHSLHAALRGLHLATGHLSPDALCARARQPLFQDDVVAVLSGTQVPDWPVIDRLVTALGGEATAIRPLWEAASDHHTGGPSQPPDAVPRLPLAFG